MRTVDEIKKDNENFKTLCRRVFSSGEGRQLMEHMERLFIDVKLYADTDRETVYAVAQRDFVVEMKECARGELPVEVEEEL